MAIIEYQRELTDDEEAFLIAADMDGVRFETFDFFAAKVSNKILVGDRDFTEIALRLRQLRLIHFVYSDGGWRVIRAEER